METIAILQVADIPSPNFSNGMALIVYRNNFILSDKVSLKC